MVNGVYAVLIAVVLVMWVWSKYLQRELTLNSVTLNVGDSFTYVFAGIIALGISVIILSNFLPIQGWKVFIFLLFMVVIDVVILWLTATWVHAVSSHKIPPKYRAESKNKENISLVTTIIISLLTLVGIIYTKDIGISVLIFLFSPILILIERAISLKGRIKKVNQYEPYTEEEVLRAEKNLERAIKDGKVLKPKDNILKKIISRERKRYRQMRTVVKSSQASTNMEEVKRRNDEIVSEEQEKGDEK